MAAVSGWVSLARWRWRLLRWWKLPAPRALMLGLSLLLLVVAILEWVQANDALLAARASEHRKPASAAEREPAPGAARRALLREFIDKLPMPGDAPAVIQSLMDIASAEGLNLPRGSYRMQPDTAGRFWRYRMNIPVQGDPLHVQRFVQAALQAHPSLAVESIQFRREDGTPLRIEARIQWVLFLRAGSFPMSPVRDPGIQATPVDPLRAGSPP